jgi:hypothetical protein
VLSSERSLDDGVLGHRLGLDAESLERGAGRGGGVVGEIARDVEPSQGAVPGDGGGLGGLPGCDPGRLSRHPSSDVGDRRGDVRGLLEGLGDDGVRRRRRWRGSSAASTEGDDAGRGGEGGHHRGEDCGEAQGRGESRGEEGAFGVVVA